MFGLRGFGSWKTHGGDLQEPKFFNQAKLTLHYRIHFAHLIKVAKSQLRNFDKSCAPNKSSGWDFAKNQ